MIIYIVQKHFEQGLLNELLSESWEEGEQTCPVCDLTPEIRAKRVNDKHGANKTVPKGWKSMLLEVIDANWSMLVNINS